VSRERNLPGVGSPSAAGLVAWRTSDVGYCVGWCCASRSSFSMCISVVFPALSSPWKETNRTRLSQRVPGLHTGD